MQVLVIRTCIEKLHTLLFQGLMKDAENTPNVVKVCNKQGLFDELEDLQKRLVLMHVCTCTQQKK